ncbi:unnamed protein product [Caenorhabditis angaria]|uniref:Uncharacterized protein n=1 Tax=Caenorhabditis angaria TaxID=860376 RepID=A0A9P1IAZ5_9PELO|nr:unnamed protein product [Caenorhabditis angaria]
MSENNSEELTQEQKRVVQSAFSSKAPRKSSASNTAPFNTCLLVLLTASILLQISAIFGQNGSFVSLFIAIFMFEWFNIHFSAMTRTRRACFDVANVLETYQPRARTHGHLFIPDPPTPCVKIADENDVAHDAPKEKNAFTNARDAHYENMYQKALQMAKEMEQNEKHGASPNMDSGENAANAELKPADPEKDKKEGEEKAKEKKKKYEDDMTKPFSC